jgi:hypothetical protein
MTEDERDELINGIYRALAKTVGGQKIAKSVQWNGARHRDEGAPARF